LSTAIKVISPRGTGTVCVVVVTAAGRSADSAHCRFTYVPPGAIGGAQE
jgi:hypothetical protein